MTLSRIDSDLQTSMVANAAETTTNTGVSADYLQGKAISAPSPTDGQSLVWSVSNQAWIASAVIGPQGSMGLTGNTGARGPQGPPGYQLSTILAVDPLQFDQGSGTISFKQASILQASLNLADINSPANARANLGLGSIATHDAAEFLAATGSGSRLTGLNASSLASGTVAYPLLPVGTTTGTIAAGDDARIIGAATATALATTNANVLAKLDKTGDASTTSVLPNGGTTSRSLATIVGERKSVKDFGAKGDGAVARGTDGVITPVDRTNLTSAGGAFNTSMVGRVIVVDGAGAAASPLVTTVAKCLSPTSLILANPAVCTVAAAAYRIDAARRGTDMVTTANQTAISSATANFTAADVGKTIRLAGAFSANRALVTTIASVASATLATLATPALVGLTATSWLIGPDDTDAVQAAFNAAATSGGGVIEIPEGVYRIAKQFVSPKLASLYVPPGVSVRAAAGTVFVQAGDSYGMIQAGDGASIDGLRIECDPAIIGANGFGLGNGTHNIIISKCRIIGFKTDPNPASAFTGGGKGVHVELGAVGVLIQGCEVFGSTFGFCAQGAAVIRGQGYGQQTRNEEVSAVGVRFSDGYAANCVVGIYAADTLTPAETNLDDQTGSSVLFRNIQLRNCGLQDGTLGSPYLLTGIGAIYSERSRNFTFEGIRCVNDAAQSVTQTLASPTGYAATGGWFSLVFGGQTTANLVYNATAAQIQAALEALSTIMPGNVVVSGTTLDTANAVLSFTFQGTLANQPLGLITINAGSILPQPYAGRMLVTHVGQAAYGKIGGFFRGSSVNATLRGCSFSGDCEALIYNRPADNLSPVSPSAVCTVNLNVDGLRHVGTADYAAWAFAPAYTAGWRSSILRAIETSTLKLGLVYRPNNDAVTLDTSVWGEFIDRTTRNCVRGPLERIHTALSNNYDAARPVGDTTMVHAVKIVTSDSDPLTITRNNGDPAIILQRTGQSPAESHILLSNGMLRFTDASSNACLQIDTTNAITTLSGKLTVASSNPNFIHEPGTNSITGFEFYVSATLTSSNHFWRWDRLTNTSGQLAHQFYVGNGTFTQNAQIGQKSLPTFFCVDNGNFGVGTMNPTYGTHLAGGQLKLAALGVPPTPVLGAAVSPSVAGSAYYYWLIAEDRSGVRTPVSGGLGTTTANVTISWPAIDGASKVYILRTTSVAPPTGNPVAKIANVGGRVLSYTDAANTPVTLGFNIPTRDATADASIDGALTAGAFLRSVASLTYAATITPTSGGIQRIIAINNSPFTINPPINPLTGATLSLDIKNGSTGTLGAITFDPVFLLSGTFTTPAINKRRTITFYYDGANWVELSRGAGDL